MDTTIYIRCYETEINKFINEIHNEIGEKNIKDTYNNLLSQKQQFINEIKLSLDDYLEKALEKKTEEFSKQFHEGTDTFENLDAKYIEYRDKYTALLPVLMEEQVKKDDRITELQQQIEYINRYKQKIANSLQACDDLYKKKFRIFPEQYSELIQDKNNLIDVYFNEGFNPQALLFIKDRLDILLHYTGGRRKTKRRRFNSKKKRNNKKRGTRRRF